MTLPLSGRNTNLIVGGDHLRSPHPEEVWVQVDRGRTSGQRRSFRIEEESKVRRPETCSPINPSDLFGVSVTSQLTTKQFFRDSFDNTVKSSVTASGRLCYKPKP
ncbi:hypothetical protein GW17_00017316 [Ensete ventricosum]|nr:hypothetical protein GW17_00017316 [Ensete ventricosum]